MGLDGLAAQCGFSFRHGRARGHQPTVDHHVSILRHCHRLRRRSRGQVRPCIFVQAPLDAYRRSPSDSHAAPRPYPPSLCHYVTFQRPAVDPRQNPLGVHELLEHGTSRRGCHQRGALVRRRRTHWQSLRQAYRLVHRCARVGSRPRGRFHRAAHDQNRVRGGATEH